MVQERVTATRHPGRHRRLRILTLALLGLTLMVGAVSAFAQGPPTLFSWNNAEPSPQRRFEGPSVVINDQLVVFGGFNVVMSGGVPVALEAQVRVDSYDPATNVWTRLNDMPAAVTHIFPVRDNNTIWFVGGFVGDDPGPATADVWLYDVSSDSWSAGPPLPAPRAGGTVAIWGRELHYIGGFADRNDTRTEHYVLDLDNPTDWTTSTPMPEARGHSAGAAVAGIIYVIGGQIRHDDSPTDQSEVFAFDSSTDRWSQVADLPTARSHFEPGTFVSDGRIIIAGGRNNVAFQPALSDISMYDPALDIWLAIPALPTNLLAPAMKQIGTDFVLANGGFDWDQPQVATYTAPWLTAWETGTADVPSAIGSTSAGQIGNEIFVVGADTPNIFSYNLTLNSWRTINSRALPPFPDENHAAVVYNDELYLFGGLSAAAGQVQIYNPVSDSWRTGTPMPSATGAAMAAVIGTDIYVAGGIVSGATTAALARYSPATDSWVSLEPMPQGRHYAAGGTDGTDFYIFGGRTGSMDVSNGFDTVQIYSPLTNSWQSSAETGSFLTPLPQARSGMGRAVYFDGEFYVMGGETDTGSGANASGVYDRVDIYNPGANIWRPGDSMATARHGFDPILVAGRIYTFGGGTSSGAGGSTTAEVFNPAAGGSSPTAISLQSLGTSQNSNRIFILAVALLALISLHFELPPVLAKMWRLIRPHLNVKHN